MLYIFWPLFKIIDVEMKTELVIPGFYFVKHLHFMNYILTEEPCEHDAL